MGAFRTLKIAGLRIGGCILVYGQASLVICRGKGGKTRAVDGLGKAYRSSQRNGRKT